MKQFWHVSKYMFSFYMRYKKGFLSYLILLGVVAILSNIEPLLYKVFVDAITKQGAKNVSLLFEVISVIALLRLVSGGLLEVVFIIYDRGFYLNSEFDLLADIFSHIQKLSFNFHQNKKSGSLISTISRGRSAYASYTYNIVFNLVYFIIGLSFLVATLGVISPKVMIVVAVTIVIYIFFSVVLLRKNVEKRGGANAADDVVRAMIADNMINYETVKYYRQEEYERERILSEKRNWFDAQYAYTRTFRAFGLMYTTITGISIFVALFVALQELLAGRITLGSFVLVLTFITALFQHLSDLFFQFREVAKNFTDLEEYIRLIGIPIEVNDPLDPVKIPEQLKGEVVFDSVTFKYHARSNVLDNVSFTALPNQMTALVGKSGAGKSTISKLLLRLYDINEGKILIDGIDLRDIRQKDIGRVIGLVPQEPMLFNNTIRYNIAYAKPDSSQEDIEEAIRVSYLTEFIASLPLGYDTEVGERGIKLSGGQKQRLAIARTIIQNPKVIVFDEATSHLDSESEHYIQLALEAISKDKTVIMIAHRLSTIMHADKILVFESGRLADQGTHEELIENSSALYHKLWTLQSTGKL